MKIKCRFEDGMLKPIEKLTMPPGWVGEVEVVQDPENPVPVLGGVTIFSNGGKTGAQIAQELRRLHEEQRSAEARASTADSVGVAK
ncbi:MAG: hypothetical protein AAF656_11425 [Planctomycetota bacterium]